MNDEKALMIVDKIFENIFGIKNNKTLDELLEQYAFDIKLPQLVHDSDTGEPTWTQLVHYNRYMTTPNMEKRDREIGWMLPKKEVSSLEEIIEIWKSIDYASTERVYNSVDVAKSDPIYRCESVYQSTNCGDGKNIIFSEGCYDCNYILACQRSVNSNFCIRTDDSNNCSNSYNVICSDKISNSLFIQDCSNLYECIFCSHISNQRFCIANMQFEEDEYYTIKKEIVDWIMSS